MPIQNSDISLCNNFEDFVALHKKYNPFANPGTSKMWALKRIEGRRNKKILELKEPKVVKFWQD